MLYIRFQVKVIECGKNIKKTQKRLILTTSNRYCKMTTKRRYLDEKCELQELNNIMRRSLTIYIRNSPFTVVANCKTVISFTCDLCAGYI